MTLEGYGPYQIATQFTAEHIPIHRVNNGKRVPMYVCGNYAKQPVGTLCQSAHRIKADHVMEIAAKTIR